MSADPLERLPQTGPARLVLEVIEHDAERTVCLARAPERSAFRALGTAPAGLCASVAIEMAAQAAAVGEPAPAGGRPAPPAGPRLLVGARDVTLHAPQLPADGTYRVVTTRKTLAPPLRVYRFEVFDGEELVAEGELSTFFDVGSG